MPAKKLIAYCGLTCSECPAYQATKKKSKKKAQEVAEAWSRAYSTEVCVEHVWCDGCTQGGKKCAHALKCEIRACGMKQGVENCGRCKEYPCGTLLNFFKMAPEARTTLELMRQG